MPEEARDLVDETWRLATARPGVKLFDGPMCRLESWSLRADVLHLELSRTSYKLFYGTNISHPELADRYGHAVLANPVGVSPALETCDGYLMMGRRNDSVAYYPSRIHPFAGALEPADSEVGEGPDLFAAVARELAEELSIASHEIAEMRCTGVVEDVALRQPELIFRVRTDLTRRQIEQRLDPDEHVSTYPIRATSADVEAALREPLLTPVGAASLLLWGRIRFGQEWFDANLV
jgi:8-oxo-dGTP pyrophosphatase MutT (NUDIX family)